jgi:hypothetical protein
MKISTIKKSAIIRSRRGLAVLRANKITSAIVDKIKEQAQDMLMKSKYSEVFLRSLRRENYLTIANAVGKHDPEIFEKAG